MWSIECGRSAGSIEMRRIHVEARRCSVAQERKARPTRYDPTRERHDTQMPDPSVAVSVLTIEGKESTVDRELRGRPSGSVRHKKGIRNRDSRHGGEHEHAGKKENGVARSVRVYGCDLGKTQKWREALEGSESKRRRRRQKDKGDLTKLREGKRSRRRG